MCSPRSSRAAALGLVLAALAPATAAAQPQDLRSPDAREPFTAPVASTDLRAPDSRDAAEGRSAADAPSVMVVRMPQRSHAGGGMDWADVGVGASGALIVLALTAGGIVAVERRRHVRSTRSTATA
jgi:hypothetical protein